MNDLEKKPLFTAIGCMSFGPWSSSDDERIESKDKLRQVIQYALQNLPNGRKLLLNTAQMYGFERGSNEKLIGKVLTALSRLDRSRILVVTKGGINSIQLELEKSDRTLYTDDDSWYEAGPDLEKAWKQSQLNLEMEKNDVTEWAYILHRCHPNPNEFEKQLYFLKTLLETKQVTRIGLSEASEDQIRTAVSIIGRLDFLETEFSPNVKFIIDKWNKKLLDNLKICVLGYSPLSRGFWTDAFDKDKLPKDPWRNMLPMWKPDNFSKLYGSLHNVRELAKTLGVKTNQLVLAWCLSHGIIPIAGSSSVENNVSNIDSFQINLSTENRNKVDALTHDMYEVWGIERYTNK